MSSTGSWILCLLLEICMKVHAIINKLEISYPIVFPLSFANLNYWSWNKCIIALRYLSWYDLVQICGYKLVKLSFRCKLTLLKVHVLMAKLLSTDEVQHVGWIHFGWVWGSMGQDLGGSAVVQRAACLHTGDRGCLWYSVAPQWISELLVLEASFCWHNVYGL